MKVQYRRDGRGIILLDAEDVELAKLYLQEQKGNSFERRIAVIKMFRDNGHTIWGAGDIVHCAWEQLYGVL
jgi:hypothetical protein